MRGPIRYRIVMICICVGAVASPLFSVAQQNPKRPRIRSIQQRMNEQQRWWRDELKAAEIGLTDEQLLSLEEMADNGREQIQPVRQRYFQTYRSLVETLANDTDDDEEIARIRAEIIEAWSELTSVGVDQLIETRKILNAEQWAKLPKVAPRAIRLGNVSLRGTGSVTSEAPTDDGG